MNRADQACPHPPLRHVYHAQELSTTTGTALTAAKHEIPLSRNSHSHHPSGRVYCERRHVQQSFIYKPLEAKVTPLLEHCWTPQRLSLVRLV
ncbi:hypothetical protein VTK56DRAFT_6699 [Thermocarpiscus australiensis]